ncbi:cold-shock protein [Streptomyces sp. CS159]|nr:cold-shock protein [Streptomyces sp. CS159]
MGYRSDVDSGKIQQYYKVGMDVIVHLGGGRSARGLLVEVGNGSVVLATEHGPSLVNADAIELIEVVGTAPPAVGPTGVAPGGAEPGTPSAAGAPSAPGSTSDDRAGSMPGRPDAAPAAQPNAAPLWPELDAEFAPGETELRLNKPSFKRDPVVDLGYSLRKEVEQHLARAKNRLESARLARDAAKAGSALRDLAAASQTSGYPPGLHLAALTLLEWREGDATRRQAEAWMEQAAHLGGRYVWDLAALRARGGRTGDAMAALSGALRTAPVENADDRLLRAFLDLALRTGNVAEAAYTLAGASEADAAQRRVAARAALYLVARLLPERAGPLEPYLDRQVIAPGDLCRILDVLSPGTSERLGLEAGGADAPPSPHSHPAPALPPASRSGGPSASVPVPHRSAESPAVNGRPTPSPSPSPAPVLPHTPGKDLHRQKETARRQFQQGNFAAAIAIARGALAEFPSDPDLTGIVAHAEAELTARVTERGSAVASPKAAPAPRPPKAQPSRPRNTLYAQAQFADTRSKDWKKAEALYRQAIAEDPGHERARRALAWGLHRYQRSDEALEVLREPGAVVQETLQHQNMIITILTDRKRLPEAARLLEELLRGEHPNQTRTGLLKRLVAVYQRQRDKQRATDAAERLLAHGPRNPEFRSIHDAVTKAVRTGVWDKLDELLARSEWQPEQSESLSPVIRMHLNRCEYAGVAAVRIQEGSLGEQDVLELTKLIERLGTSRPADRAEFNLSAARILRDISQTTDPRFLRSLRAFGAAMGDLCAAERRPSDVTRAYYTEALALGGGWDNMAELKVKQFVTSYLDPGWEEPKSRSTFTECVHWVLEDKSRHKPLTMGLVGLLSVSPVRVRREIMSMTYRDNQIRDVLFRELRDFLSDGSVSTSQDAYRQLWDEAQRNHVRLVDQQRTILQALLQRTDPLGTLTEDRNALESTSDTAYTAPLDRDRLVKAAGVLAELRAYLEQPSYLEQERLSSRIGTSIRELVATIERLPTRLSVEYLVPLLTSLDQALTAHFAQVQRAAEPTDLAVKEVLSAYTPDAANVIEVQLSVTNPPHRSPAGGVQLRVLQNDEDYERVDSPVPVAHTLRDEQTETCTVSLTVTPKAIREQFATLRFRLEYSSRSERMLASEASTLSLQLSDVQQWEAILNPYAEGAPVRDRRMFFGRDALLGILVDTFHRNDATCVVIYGQKRVGKSSVLHHLQEELKPPVLAAKLSLLEIATEIDHGQLLYLIATAFHRRLEELEDAGHPPLDLDRPNLTAFTDSDTPNLHFDAYMYDMRQRMRRSEAYQNWRLVLLLDEFTVLYSAIERGTLPREFMKSWKAMLEGKMFSSVVVGNDLMPRFLKAFPNEFQVARQEPVSYLDQESAEALITEPIALPGGESRYRGDSVQRVIELTARSPYYIQLFCNRLVQHMNRLRQPLIGPAHVDAVAASLVKGERALPQEQFDNLLTPGDADVSELRDDVVLSVLKGALEGVGKDVYVDGRKSRELVDGQRVVEDLLRRDVIELASEGRYRIKVGLFTEWLSHRRA